MQEKKRKGTMNINAINNINFGQRHISTLNTKNNGTPLNFVEYEYGFYDMLHLREQVDKWEPSKGNGGKKLYNNFCDQYMNGGFLKRYFGVEDDEGNVKAIMEADVQSDKTNKDEFGTMKQSQTAFSPDIKQEDASELKKEINIELKKHSDECKDIFSDIINRRTRILSFGIDENGENQTNGLELNA